LNSSIEGEYVPLPGDEVSYRICAIPPKFEKFQAIHVSLTNLVPEIHVKWESHAQMEDGKLKPFYFQNLKLFNFKYF
jgi:hypothetical protein